MYRTVPAPSRPVATIPARPRVRRGGAPAPHAAPVTGQRVSQARLLNQICARNRSGPPHLMGDFAPGPSRRAPAPSTAPSALHLSTKQSIECGYKPQLVYENTVPRHSSRTVRYLATAGSTGYFSLSDPAFIPNNVPNCSPTPVHISLPHRRRLSFPLGIAACALLIIYYPNCQPTVSAVDRPAERCVQRPVLGLLRRVGRTMSTPIVINFPQIGGYVIRI